MAVVRRSKPLPKAKAKVKATQPEADIPSLEEINIPPASLFDYTICLFGEKGIGKTSLAAQFPNSLTFMWELGRKNLAIRQMPRAGGPPLTWASFLAAVEKVVQDHRTLKIETVVIDTIDRAYEACLQHCCEESGIDDPNDMKDYGAMWRKIKHHFEFVLDSIRSAGLGLVVISHAKVREIETRSGDGFDLLVPTCPQAAWSWIKTACDFAFYYGYHDRLRTLTFRGNDLIWSACGVDDHFCDTAGTPLEMIPVGETPAMAYKTLLAAWENKVPAPKLVKKVRPHKD